MSPIDLPKIYNPAIQSKQELIDNFVVRTELFAEILNDIKTSEMKHPEQHYIIQGNRGQGKTTLLLRIAYEIENDLDLSNRLIPILFNEEQYNISRLFKLWESIAEYLQDSGHMPGLYEQMQSLDYDDDFERRCFELLENALIENHKKIIVFIDNIDELFEKLSKQEHHRLREVFIESAEIRVIGASSTLLEFHHDYGKPFYQFFKMPHLKGLNIDETQKLLLGLGEHYKKDRVKEIVKNQPGRIEALRRLTGGVIRTIIILFEIFVDDENGSAFKDLEKILDTVTPLYKHRMDKLSAQQQEIVDFIALNWEAVSVKDIARKTKMESKAVSAQLGKLEKYSIIEKEKTTTKNYLYRIQERFFNIWYLMRLGRKWDERRVRFVVEFLQIWCDDKELENRANGHLNALKKGKLLDRHALFMTEALIRTPIKSELKGQLLDSTRTYLQKNQSELCEFLPDSEKISEEYEIRDAQPSDVLAKISTTKKKTDKIPQELIALGIFYLKVRKDTEKAQKFFLEALEKGNAGAMFFLGLLHHTASKDYDKAKEYYLMAVEKGDSDAMYNLALLYETDLKDYGKAKEYYLMAVEKGDSGAMNNLAWLNFEEKKNKEQAVEFSRKSYEKEVAPFYAHTYATMLLWDNQIKEAAGIAESFLNDVKFLEEYTQEAIDFMLLLIAKKQYHLALKIFEANTHGFKDRFMPVYYALMFFMKNEFPNEYIKMGGELKETVEEIIAKINQWEKDYQ